MLCLTRKKEEKIVIGENITITIIAIHGGSVRLGIEAPRDVPIHRSELLPLNQPREPANKGA
jgi:carbon storage regulator